MNDESRKADLKHPELDVYKRAFDAAMVIFRCSRAFSIEERYSLTDQVRRSSRSVCANLAEAWRKRRYAAALVSKLTDSESKAAETQVWIQFAVQCGYLNRESATQFYDDYETILAQLVTMSHNSKDWIIQ